MEKKKTFIESIVPDVQKRRMPECFDPCKAHDKALDDNYSMITWNHLYHAVKRFRKHPVFQVFYDKRISTAKDDPYFIDDIFTLAMELDRLEYNATLMTCESREK